MLVRSPSAFQFSLDILSQSILRDFLADSSAALSILFFSGLNIGLLFLLSTSFTFQPFYRIDIITGGDLEGS